LLLQLLDKQARLTLSGHSMGGAVAVIVAMKLMHRGFHIDRVVTFGAPMVTNTEGCELHRSVLPLLRVCHEEDVVPVLPPFSAYELLTSAWMGIYEHFGQQLLLVRSHPDRVCYLKGESEAQWWQHSFWLNLPLLSQPSSHLVSAYLERLELLQQGKASIVKYNHRLETDAADHAADVVAVGCDDTAA